MQLSAGAGSATSTASKIQLTVAPAGPVASTVASGGAAVTIGGVVSCTVMVNMAMALLPDASVAVQVTGVARGGRRPVRFEVNPNQFGDQLAPIPVRARLALADVGVERLIGMQRDILGDGLESLLIR